jgi:hypothetical protein
MSEGHAPALKIPEPERVKEALALLASQGITSAAKKDDNTITIGAKEAALAADIMSRAIQNGMLQAAPQMVSDNAIDVPDSGVQPVTPTHEPHPPEGGVAFGEEAETEQNDGKIDAEGNVELNPRSLNNRKQNQLKKIDESEDDGHPRLQDQSIISAVNSASRAVTPTEMLEYVGLPDSTKFAERMANLAEAGHFMSVDGKFTKNNPVVATFSEEVEQIDELSIDTLKKVANVARKKNRPDVLKAAIKAGQRNKNKPDYKFAEEVEQIDELSYGKLKAYTKAGTKAITVQSGADRISKKIAQRKAYLDKAAAKKVKIISKAAFGEESNTPVDTILRVITEAAKLRLIAVHHSEDGKHQAKVYKDHEWGEHRVKYFYNGKHHEPADSHHGDAEDAHDTAKMEMKRATKLTGALKEAAEKGELPFLSEGIVKCGTYTNKSGAKVTLHKSESDPSHHMIVHNGKVVGSHQGTSKEVHDKMVKDGFSGSLKEESVQIDELGPGTLTNYLIKAGQSKNQHAAKGAAKLARGNSFRTEPEVKEKLHKDAAKHMTKANNRASGMKKAASKLVKDCHTAGVCESEQIVEVSKDTLKSYIGKAMSDVEKNTENAVKTFKAGGKVTKYLNRQRGIVKAINKLTTEEVDLTEGKKDDVEKAKKHLFKLPIANDIGQSMHTASRHFNYVQDACDHVYSNHCKDLPYEDYDKIKPHLEDHFKAHGLK